MSVKMKKEAKVLSQKILSDGIYDMWLETPMAEYVKPGQFVGVYPVNKSTLLPRPSVFVKYQGKDRQSALYIGSWDQEQRSLTCISLMITS